MHRVQLSTLEQRQRNLTSCETRHVRPWQTVAGSSKFMGIPIIPRAILARNRCRYTYEFNLPK